MGAAKSAAERAAEVARLRMELEGAQLTQSQELAPLQAALDDFAQNGVSWQQAVRLRDLGVRLHVQLTTRPHLASSIRVSRVQVQA